MSKPPGARHLPEDVCKHNVLWLHEACGSEKAMSPPPVAGDHLIWLGIKIPARDTHKELRTHAKNTNLPSALAGSPASTDVASIGAMGDVFKEVLQVVAKNADHQPIAAKIATPTSQPKEKSVLSPKPKNFLTDFDSEKNQLPVTENIKPTFEVASDLDLAIKNQRGSNKDEKPKKRRAPAGDDEVATCTSSRGRKPAASSVKSGTTPALKTPAAAGMKKPGAASKTISQSKTTSSELCRFVDIKDKKGKVLITAQYRKKYYPKGCPKYRKAIGCTPSCYVYRKEC